MASGTYTFTVSRDTIIRQALLSIGKLGENENPTPNETTDCSVLLNMMVKQWMGRLDFANGLKMWTRYRGDLFLSFIKGSYILSTTGDNWAVGVTNVLNPNRPWSNRMFLTAATAAAGNTFTVGTTNIAGFSVNDFVVIATSAGDIFSSTVASINSGAGTFTTASNLPAGVSAFSGATMWNYTTKGQPLLEIQSAILRDNQDNDTPLNYMTLPEYEALPTKIQSGYVSDPTAIYHEPQLTSGSIRSTSLYLDVSGAQDVTKQLHIVGLRSVQDFVNPTDAPDYPQEWFLPLSLGLGKLCCPMFNAVWTKENESNFTGAIAMAREGTTAETSTAYFQCHADDF